MHNNVNNTTAEATVNIQS